MTGLCSQNVAGAAVRRKINFTPHLRNFAARTVPRRAALRQNT